MNRIRNLDSAKVTGNLNAFCIAAFSKRIAGSEDPRKSQKEVFRGTLQCICQSVYLILRVEQIQNFQQCIRAHVFRQSQHFQ